MDYSKIYLRRAIAIVSVLVLVFLIVMVLVVHDDTATVTNKKSKDIKESLESANNISIPKQQ